MSNNSIHVSKERAAEMLQLISIYEIRRAVVELIKAELDQFVEDPYQCKRSFEFISDSLQLKVEAIEGIDGLDDEPNECSDETCECDACDTCDCNDDDQVETSEDITNEDVETKPSRRKPVYPTCESSKYSKANMTAELAAYQIKDKDPDIIAHFKHWANELQLKYGISKATMARAARGCAGQNGTQGFNVIINGLSNSILTQGLVYVIRNEYLPFWAYSESLLNIYLNYNPRDIRINAIHANEDGQRFRDYLEKLADQVSDDDIVDIYETSYVKANQNNRFINTDANKVRAAFVAGRFSETIHLLMHGHMMKEVSQ